MSEGHPKGDAGRATAGSAGGVIPGSEWGHHGEFKRGTQWSTPGAKEGALVTTIHGDTGSRRYPEDL